MTSDHPATSPIVNLVIMHEARARCIASNNTEWVKRWSLMITALCTLLPSGSGIDDGTRVQEVDSRRVILELTFHHLNDVGNYDGWTEHKIRVTPGWRGPELTISGRDRNEIKHYLHDVYHSCLTALVEWHEDSQRWTFVDDPPRGVEPGPSASTFAITGNAS